MILSSIPPCLPSKPRSLSRAACSIANPELANSRSNVRVRNMMIALRPGDVHNARRGGKTKKELRDGWRLLAGIFLRHVIF
jgi:hypothetical protein